MKTILLSLTLLIAFPVFSQNYRTVSTDSEVYFDFKDYAPFLSRIINTSNYQVDNNDTIIYHQMNQEFDQSSFLDSNLNESTCYYPVDTGFLGYKTILETDGKDIFFNRFDDSIFIKTNALLNDSWIFYEDSTYHYEAVVSNISYDSFLGISDSVKTITLQAKDSLGNTISTPYDFISIKISKHHGLIQGFNFFHFPYGVATATYLIPTYKKINILGLPAINAGIDNLTAAAVYDFNVGDEFQYTTTYYHGENGVSCETVHYDLNIVTNKQYSNNGDSVYYTIDLQSYVLDCSINNPPIPTPTTTVFDTLFVSDTIIGYDISIGNVINTKTLQRDSDSLLWKQSADGNMKTTQTFSYWNMSGCYPMSVSPTPSLAINYHRGLGTTFHLIDIPGYGETRKEFVYYNKNGNTWGTPLNIDSLSTVSTSSVEKQNLSLKIFPNPATDLLNFQLEEPINNAEIRIYSSIGQLVGQKVLPLPQTEVQFNVANWQNGMYFYGIFVENEMVKSGQVLIGN